MVQAVTSEIIYLLPANGLSYFLDLVVFGLFLVGFFVGLVCLFVLVCVCVFFPLWVFFPLILSFLK